MKDNNLYDLYNEDTKDFVTLTRLQLIQKGLSKALVSGLLSNKLRSAGEFILLDTYSNEQTLLDVTKFYELKEEIVIAFSGYLTTKQKDIILYKGDQWLTDLTISRCLGPTLRAFCPRC